MKRNWYGGIGSISTGACRNEDLIPAMVSEAQSLKLTREERKAITRIARHSEASEDDAYWTDEVADFDREELENILCNHALPYFYFGAHPGDGADIGWWLSEEFEEEFADCSTTFAKTNGAYVPQGSNIKVNDTADIPKGFTGEVLHVNDHGNITLYAVNRGRKREVWAIV